MEEQDLEIIREFLVESHENLSRLDQELVELEKHPGDAARLASIFRTIHTIKGTCGFLAFTKLERITHEAENLLSQLRDGQRSLTPVLVSLILETVDATRKVLASIEATGQEGTEPFLELVMRLKAAAELIGEVEFAPVARVPAINEIPEATVQAQSPPVNATDPAEPAKVEEEWEKTSAVADANIRVGVGLLDKLMDLVGELVLTRNQILQFNTEREDPALNATAQRLNLITTELQEGVMKTRMQPIGMVWNKLPRVVRDMAVALGKQIRLEMDGAATELDRTIIEAIKDPLVHLVRNACDHGIESPDVRVKAGKLAQGRLTLRAYHEGGQVNIEIGDDGAGINVDRIKQRAIEKGLLRPEGAQKMSDREAFNLIFHPGFSTAQTVTNVSGRGVGMDVVKSKIEKIGGVVDIASRPGEGSVVKLKIPLTLAIIPGLVVSSGGERFVIPQVSLLELVRLEGDSLDGARSVPGAKCRGQSSRDKQIEYVHGTPVYRRRGRLLPIAYLNEVLALKQADRSEAVNIVVLQAEDRQFGLVVDGINDTQEIVVKPLSKQLKNLSVYAGATIMGDGRVALILDVLGIGQSSGVLAESREQSRSGTTQQAQPEMQQQRLLLFRAGAFERLAVPLSLVARLEEFPQSSIEQAGGRQVVQYRNRILPLIPLRTVLDGSSPDPATDPVQVIVFDEGDRSVGVVVDQILDVAEEAVKVRKPTARKGLLGSAVVGKRIADFLDLNYVIRSAGEDWSQRVGNGASGRSILIAEGSAFSRGLIRSGLDMAGYAVVEAANYGEAIRELETRPIDIVVTSVNLPPTGGRELVMAIRSRPEWRTKPIVGLADSSELDAGQSGSTAGLAGDFQDVQAKFDREGMLESIARLEAALTAAEPAVVGTGN